MLAGNTGAARLAHSAPSEAETDQSASLTRWVPPSLIYVLIALAWITFSDQLLRWAIPSPAMQSWLQTFKGFLFVLATGATLHWLIRRVQRRNQQDSQRIAALSSFYQALSTVSAAAMRAENQAQLFDSSCRALLDHAAVRVAAVVLLDAKQHSLTPACVLGPAAALYEQALSADPSSPDAATVSLRAVLARSACFCDDLHNEPGFEAFRSRYAAHGVQAFAALPLYCHDELVGTLTLGCSHPQFFDAERRQLLLQLAETVSFGLGHLQRLKRLRLMDRLIERANDGVIVTDAAARIVAVNPRFCEITGFSEAEALGQTPSLIASGRHGRDFYQSMWQRLHQSGHWRGEIWNKRKNGELYPEWLTISAVRGERGEIENYLAVFSDLSERLEAEQRIRELTSIDLLTGLLNAEVFRARLVGLLQEVRAHKGRAAVAVLNLNRLRVINQVYGREKGDVLLSQIGQRLQSLNLKGALIGRLGGDEFGIAVPGMHTLEDVLRAARSVSACFNALFLLDNDTLMIRPSIGVVCFPEHGEDAISVLSHATAAMQRCKREGTDTLRLYTPDLSQDVSAPFELEQDLRRAIDNGELWLAFQPQIDMRSERVIGMETLLRWTHPTLGPVSPAKFIPVAEESGLILPIGEWVLAEACRQAARWNQGRATPLRVAVNVSAVQFQRQNWPRLVEKILNQTGLPAECLELEVTESVVMQHIDAVAMRLRALKALGVQLAIDDFGTGYSSLAYLKRLPIDRLKIDQSFVRGLPSDSGDMAICRAIVGLASSLGFSLIAEGVETAEQATCLFDMGCCEAQGWRYARAMPGDEFLTWLQARP